MSTSLLPVRCKPRGTGLLTCITKWNVVKRRGTCLFLYVPQTPNTTKYRRVHMCSSSLLWCLMVIYPSVCGPMSPCCAHTQLHPGHTSPQGGSCGCHRLCIRPCGMDNTLQRLPAHQEQHPSLSLRDFSSSHTLGMRKHLPRPWCKKGN